MRVDPPKGEQERRPWGLLTGGVDGIRAVLEDGQLIEAAGGDESRQLLAALGEHQLYARSTWRQLAVATDAREWTMRTWRRQRITSMRHRTGTRVTPIPALLPTGEHDAVNAVGEWADWLRSYGVEPRALSTSAERLWTTTLTGPLVLRCPVDPTPALFGGRMHAPFTDRFTDVRYQDIAAAYPASLAAMPAATKWVERGPGPRSVEFDQHRAGLADVTVTLPSDDWNLWGCLPVRAGDGDDSWPTDGRTVRGVYTIDDLASGLETGLIVDQVHGAWYPRAERDVWAGWWARAVDGRERCPDNKLVKSTIARLWGRFAMHPAQGEMTCEDRWGNRTQHRDINDPDAATPDAMAVAAYVSAFTAARVRRRVFTEALDTGKALYCDTDGVITRADTYLQPNSGQPGTWRITRHMAECEVAAPQVLRWRYLSDPTGEWHYSVSGVPPSAVASIFAQAREHGGGGLARGKGRPRGDAAAAPL